MPRQSDRAATARFKPRFMVLSSNRTTPQVDQATHTEAFGDFAQLLAAGREESAQQPIPAQLLGLKLPALGATAQALEFANSHPFRIFGSPWYESQTIFWPLSLVSVMRHRREAQRFAVGSGVQHHAELQSVGIDPGVPRRVDALNASTGAAARRR